MNKILLFCFGFILSFQIINAQPFYLRGSHGAPCDWGNTNALCQLSGPGAGGVYSIDFTTPANGLNEFKIYDAGSNTWYGGPSGANSWYVASAGTTMTISFNPSTNAIRVVGDQASQSNICAPGDWTVPNWTNTTPTNNGCFTVSNAGSYQWKPTFCGTWASWSPFTGERDVNASNWAFTTVLDNQDVCVTYDASTGQVIPPPPPSGFYVRGTFACDFNNLNPGCQLTDPDRNGIFEVTLDLGSNPIGCQEFKIFDADNNMWWPNGANSWFDHVGGKVTFYFNKSTKRVTVKDHSDPSICAPGNYIDPAFNNSSPMTYVGSNTWCFVVPEAGSYSWKPTYCGKWLSWEPNGVRSVNSANWSVTTECDNQSVCVKYFPATGEVQGPITSTAPANLTCNDHVNVTVNDQCTIDIPISSFLEADGGVPPALGVTVTDNLGNIVTDYSAYLSQTLTYTITDGCNGNSCWGTLRLEDKTAPVIDCEICPPVNGNSADDYDPDCVLNCYEQPILQLRYDDGLRDDLVQEDYDDFQEDAMSDNCNNWNEEDVSFYDRYTSFGACEGTRLTRVWTVGYTKADGSRGTVSCTREYFFRPMSLASAAAYALDANGNPIIEPIEDALVLPPERVELPCGVDVSPAGIAAFFDNPLTIDRDTDDNNIDPDELDIDLVVENNEGNVWAYPHYYQDGVGSGGPHPQAINNEICNIITGYTDSEIDACAEGCNGNRKVLRNWTVLDWCAGQFVTYGQIIKSIDKNPPVLTVRNTTASVDPWECTATVRLPAPEHIGDDCDNDITYTIGNRNGFSLSGNATDGFVLHRVPLGTHTIEYKSEDCCGNVGRTTMTVTVVDNTPPVAVSKEFIVISLTNIGNPVNQFQGVAKLYAKDVDNGSYDGCSDISLSVRRTPVCQASDANWGPFVSFCCEDLNGGTQANIDVELRILDANGNENIVWATVLLEDKSATIPQIPPHMFLTCDMDYNNLEMTGGVPRFFGACGEAEIECDTAEVYENTEPRELRASDGVIIDGIGPITAPAYDPSCGFGAIRRQFRDCGGGIQWFVILPVDPFDPSTIVWPDDAVVNCDDYETGEPSWEEATCNLVGVSMKADTFLFEDGACYKILNHWSVINWCVYDPSNPGAGGRYQYTQTIKIIDTVDPVLTVEDSLCFAVTTDCVSSGVSLSGSATDEGDCGSEWISWDVSIDAYADWTEDFHYATSNRRLLPNGEPNPYHIAKTGNGEPATITLPDGIPSSGIWHRAVWRAFDGCGNTSSVTRYFQIVDKKAPTPYCLNLSTAVMSNGQVELWAIDFNVGSFDNCTDSDNLLFTFTDVAPPPRDDTEYDSNSDLMWYNGTFWYYDSTNGDYESQDDYGGDVHRWEPGLRSAGKVFTTSDADASGFAQVPIYVWDENGNKDFCLVNLRLVDNGGGGMAMVAGQVKTEYGDEVEQVLTELDGPLNFRETDMTDAQGEYAFVNTPFYADYQVRGEKNDDYLNGVSTLDLVMIQRHILGQQLLDSPYRMIAADANNDKQITALDLIELRKLILGIYNELPASGSWKFVNADNSLNVNAPWAYSELRSIEDLASDLMGEDFIGVKIGDVNGSAVANATMKGETVSQSSSAVEISYEDKVVQEGDMVEISFNTSRDDIYGYQFTLNTPGLELVDVQGVKADNIAVFDGKLTMSYNETQALAPGTLVKLVMKSTTNARVSDLLEMGSDVTKAEAYVGNDLNIVNIDLKDGKTASNFALYQNEPNPFSDYTMVRFDLPEAAAATLTLYDVTGKVLNVIQGNYAKGENTIRLTKEDLGVSGMVYYQLRSGNYSAVKHMIIIQ